MRNEPRSGPTGSALVDCGPRAHQQQASSARRAARRPHRERAIGRQRALDMILRARTVTGPEALAMGLVDEVWPLDELKDRAVALATELARQPRLAVKGMLDALHDAEHKTLDELLTAERAAVHATMGTPDAREGMLAFLEKREPVFNQPSDDD